MSLCYLYVILSLVTSLVMGLLLIPAITAFCKRKSLYDKPNGRKVHSGVVPRLGGISFMPCMVLSSMLAMAVFNSGGLGLKISISLWALYFFIGILLIYAVGVVDDLIDLSPRTKFLVQVFAATILPLSGLYINNLYGLFGIHHISFIVGMPLTIVCIVFIVNAINLIDGIDGLASGLSLVALVGFFVMFFDMEMWAYAILIAGLVGVLLAFMRFNLFGKAGRDKIFMGDSGSLTLGFILATLFLRCSMSVPESKMPFDEGMLRAGSLLVVPIFDVFRVMICRASHHRSMFAADKNHIHHKLMRAGLTQRQALFVILVVGISFIVLNGMLCMSFPWVVFVDVVVWLFIHLAIDYGIRKKRNVVFI